jgi:hypothetical protein
VGGVVHHIKAIRTITHVKTHEGSFIQKRENGSLKPEDIALGVLIF